MEPEISGREASEEEEEGGEDRPEKIGDSITWT